jgi:hypothetical protein
LEVDRRFAVDQLGDEVSSYFVDAARHAVSRDSQEVAPMPYWVVSRKKEERWTKL